MYSFSFLPFGNSVHQIHLMILREREGGRGRVEKGIKTVCVSLTFWNDFYLNSVKKDTMKINSQLFNLMRMNK